jgi:hypothetical protein
MKAHGKVDVYNHAFLTLALIDGEWLASGLYHPSSDMLSSGW